MSKSRARLLAELLNTDGLVLESKSALSGADGIVDLDNLPTITNAKLENSSISIAGHSTALGGSVSLNTADITEHTDYLYFTDARARSAISVSGSLAYNSTTGVLSYTQPTNISTFTNDSGYLTSHQSLAAYAPLASPALTGTPTAPTASAGTNTTQIATTAYVTTAVDNIVDAAPGTLNTLNELAAALGDDANFSTTITNSIATKLPLAGGTLTGTVTFGDNNAAIFGAGSDLQIYHDASNSYIYEAGTGDLVLQTNGAKIGLAKASPFEWMLEAETDGAVSLYYDNSKKLATTSTGIDVTGTVTANDLTLSDATPLLKLQDSDGTNQTLEILESSGSGFITSQDGSSHGKINFRRQNGTDTFRTMQILPSGDIVFYADDGTTQAFRWDASTSRLGLGTTSPGTTLHLSNSDPRITLTDTDAGGNFQIRNTSGVAYISTLGAHPMLFSTDSAERMRIASDGNVGIGATNPTSTLDIVAPTNYGLKVRDGTYTGIMVPSGLGGIAAGTTSNHPFILLANNTERMRVTSTGIDVTGTVTADGLTVDGSATISGANRNITFIETDTTDVNGRITQNGGQLRLQTIDDALSVVRNRLVIDHASGDISFYNNAGTSQDLFWDASTSRLGVGNTAPSYDLHIGDGTSDVTLALQSSDTGTTRINLGDATNAQAGSIIYENDVNEFTFRRGGATAYEISGAHTWYTQGGSRAMDLDSAGNVGIGTSAPIHRLSVDSSNRLWNVNDDGASNYVTTSATNTSGSVVFHRQVADRFHFGRAVDGTDDKLIIDSSGNVVIGSTSAKTRLQSSGAGVANAPALGSVSSNAPLYLTNNDTAYGLVVGTNSADGHAWLQAQRTDGTATAYNLTLNEAGGNVGIGTSSPSEKLEINGNLRAFSAGYPLIDLGVSTSNYFRLIHDNPNDLFQIGKNGAGTLKITGNGDVIASGNVGIGVVPSVNLQVKTTTATNETAFRVSDDVTQTLNVIVDGTASTGGIHYQNPNAGYQRWSTSGIERMRITSAGAIQFNQAYTFPTSDGTNGQVLQTDGSGNLSFADAGSGSGDITAVVAGTNLTGGATSGSATINLATNLSGLGTISSGAITSTGISSFSSLNIGADSDIYLYESATNKFTIRTGTTSAYKYFTFEDDGTFKVLSGGITTTGDVEVKGHLEIDSNNGNSGLVISSDGSFNPGSVGGAASNHVGLFWHTSDTYGIYRTSGAWSGNYQQLRLRWDTGIELNGGTAHGLSGVRVIGGNSSLLVNGNIAWNAGNDGSGSGLDADTLDSIQASSFVRNDVGGQQVQSYLTINDSGNFSVLEFEDSSNVQRAHLYHANSSAYFGIGVFDTSGGSRKDLVLYQNGTITWNGGNVWHAGNDGSGSGLDADLLDGYGASTSATGSTIALRSGNADISVRLIRSTYGSQGTADATARIAFRNDNGTSDNYIRTMTNTGFVGWLNLQSGLDADLLDGKDHTNFGATLATYGTTAGASGRIRCTAPFATNSAHMFQITISLYKSYQIEEYVVGGYMYPTNNQWYLPKCIYTGTTTPDIIVGRDSSGYAYISIANGDYTGVRVHNMTRGYQTSLADTHDSWTITIDAGTENSVTPTISKVWHSTNDGSGSGLDADLLDGLDSGIFFKSYTNNNGGWSQANRNFSVRSGGDAVGLHMEESDGTFGFQLYGDGSNYGFLDAEWSNWDLKKTTNGQLQIDEGSGLNKVWTAGNDGSGSGLDADTLDGIQGASFLRSDAADTFTGTLTMGTQVALVPNDYGRGLFGLYSATRHQHIWSIGAAYKLADNGASVGNLYGLSYTHTNIGTGYGSNAATGLGHQLNGRANGTLQWALGDGIWSAVTGNVWGASNDGSGSGLDADLLDGQHGSYYFSSANYPDRTNFENVYNNLITSTGSGADLNNTFLNDRSGNFDCWGADGAGSLNHPPGTTHVQGIQVRHSTSTDYGWQIASQYNQAAIWKRQVTNGSFSGWAQIWTSTTDGSGSGLDADTLDGIDSARVIYGGTATGTYNANPTVTSSPYQKSGFYDVNGTANNAPTNTYYSYINMRHTNTANNHGHQIAGSFYSTGDIYNRNINNNSYGAWTKIWNAGNDGSGSGLDADTLDGLQASYFAPNANIVHKNANTMTGSAFKMGFHSGAGGTTFSANHYSMGVDYANGAWTNPNYSDLIIGYHTGIRIGGAYSGVRFYNNSPTTDANNDGNGDGNEVLLMTVGGGGTASSGAHVYIENSLYIKNGGSTNNVAWNAGNDGSGSGLDADLLDGNDSTAFPKLAATNTWGNNHINYFRVERGGYSGSINTANLQAYTTGANSAYMSFHRAGAYAVNMGLDADNVLRIGGWSASANRWVLDMSGNMTAAGNVTAYSDIRLKENIEVIPNALEKLKQIRGVTFTRNDQDDKELRHTGVIAQEVEKVLPEVVSEDNLGVKNVAYGNMVGLLIEAIKELKQEVDDLKSQLKEK